MALPPPPPPPDQQPPQPPQLPIAPPDYPDLTINPLPAPDQTTHLLRQYVDCLLRIANLNAAQDEDPKNIRILNQILSVYDECEALAQQLMAYPTLTVTNYSEYSVLMKIPGFPLDTKVWVHENTSPRSTACIRRQHEQIGGCWRILFASELTAEEIAADRDQLFNSKNPNYSSESSSVVDSGSSGSSYGYSDEELAALAAETDRINKTSK